MYNSDSYLGIEYLLILVNVVVHVVLHMLPVTNLLWGIELWLLLMIKRREQDKSAA